MFSPLDIARYQTSIQQKFDHEPEPAVKHKPQNSKERSKNPLRPSMLDELIGQDKLKGYLRRIIGAAKARGVPMDHTLLVGPAGTGKTTVANIIANELGVDCYQLEAPITKSTLLELREVVKDGDVVFLDEALAVDTPILTPAGWKAMGNLEVGDQVFGSDGRPTRVVNATPITHGRPCYRVTMSDGSSVVADANHRWLAAPKVRSGSTYLKPRVVTTQQMVDSGRSWRIPRHDAIEMPEVELPMDPYLLGQWLGNGCVGQQAVTVRTELVEGFVSIAAREYGLESISITPSSSEATRRVSLGTTGSGGPWGSNPSQARRDLEAAGVFNDKKVPIEYLYSSKDQRLALLRGLMDSDGHIDSSGYCIFSTTNSQIGDCVVWIARSLGLRATKKEAGVPEGTHKQCYKIGFRPTPEVNPFLLRDSNKVLPRGHKNMERIESIEMVDSVPVRCIEVDAEDHLFLAGHGMIPTHNCHRQGMGKSEDTAPEILYHFMEDFVVPTSNGILEYPRVTVIGATTDEGELPRPMLDRFPLKPQILPYEPHELAMIALHNADALGLQIERQACIALACAAGDAPRNVNSLVKNAASICSTKKIDLALAHETIVDLNGMTLDGLTRAQQDYLLFLSGQAREIKGEVVHQASVTTIATGIGKPRDPKGMTEIVEPLLVKRGLVQITNGGRRLTPRGLQRAVELQASK